MDRSHPRAVQSSHTDPVRRRVASRRAAAATRRKYSETITEREREQRRGGENPGWRSRKYIGRKRSKSSRAMRRRYVSHVFTWGTVLAPSGYNAGFKQRRRLPATAAANALTAIATNAPVSPVAHEQTDDEPDVRRPRVETRPLDGPYQGVVLGRFLLLPLSPASSTPLGVVFRRVRGIFVGHRYVEVRRTFRSGRVSRPLGEVVGVAVAHYIYLCVCAGCFVSSLVGAKANGRLVCVCVSSRRRQSMIPMDLLGFVALLKCCWRTSAGLIERRVVESSID
mmetsp:Transcript_56202/g.168266  ORF Transcript_56202/g.168266 Transcript_56202/m.168266 type:complete len:281 (+) Transcript_56202:755-1597(+)